MPFDPNDPDSKKALEDAVAAATNGLISKRDELLGEVRKLKAERGEADEVKAELDRLKEEKARKEGDFTTLEQRLKDTHAAELAKRDQQLTDQTAKINKLLIDNGLADALDAVNISPALKKAVTAMLREQVTVTELDGNLAAVVDNKPLNDFVKEWAGTDEGSAFVSAPESKGGGAPGGTNNATNKGFGEMTDVERVALKNSDPDAYRRSVDEFNRSK